MLLVHVSLLPPRRLKQLAPAYWKVEVIYYVVIQVLFTTNQILLTMVGGSFRRGRGWGAHNLWDK